MNHIHSHDFICSFNNLLSSGILVFLLHLIYNFSHVLKKSTEKYSANNDKKRYKFVMLIAEKFKAMLIDDNRSEMMCSLCESELLTLYWGSNNNDSINDVDRSRCNFKQSLWRSEIFPLIFFFTTHVVFYGLQNSTYS